MSYLTWFLRIAVFILLVTFAAKNSDTITLSYYLEHEYQLPLSVALLIFFALGISFGYLSAISNKSKKK